MSSDKCPCVYERGDEVFCNRTFKYCPRKGEDCAGCEEYKLRNESHMIAGIQPIDLRLRLEE